MQLRSVCLLALTCLSGAAQAQVNALPPTRHILVYGQAAARAVPDRFKIEIEFDAVDPDPGAARERVESRLRETVAQLEAAGAPADEIGATSLEIGPRQRYDSATQEHVHLGTGVKRTLTARFADKAGLERFLARVKTSKELSISEVKPQLSSEAELRRQLREKAIASSREKAETIARAYGARLGKIYSVSDVAPQFDYGVREGEWPALYAWEPIGAGGKLDRIQVTASRISGGRLETLRAGYVDFDDKIYTVFLLAD